MKEKRIQKTTEKEDYTSSLLTRQSKWWKRLLNVQYPYKKNIISLKPRFVLDIGCGVGRNLLHLEGYGIGIDHNKTSVQECRARGLRAYTNREFENTIYNQPGQFDSILLAHVAEHMTLNQSVQLLVKYLPLVKNNGRLIIITPQEAGYRSDDTHVEFIDFYKQREIIEQSGCTLIKQYSFPFPAFAGKFFKYNEFISIGQKVW